MQTDADRLIKTDQINCSYSSVCRFGFTYLFQHTFKDKNCDSQPVFAHKEAELGFFCHVSDVFSR